MKRWLFTIAGMAAAFTVLGQLNETGFTGRVDQTGRPIVDYMPDKPTLPRLFDEATARVYVRFDDGRAEQYTYNQIQAFLRRGLPVALAINSGTIGDEGSMTWDQIRNLQAFARSKGTVLHLMQHTNDNFATPFALTHDEVVAELDPTEILTQTGYRPRSLVVPGDTGRVEWWRRNREYINGVADSLGLWYTVSQGSSPVSTGDSLSWLTFDPTIITADTYGSNRSSFKLLSLNYVGPGMGIDRHQIPTATLDLGNTVVERVTSDLPGNFSPTGNEPTTNIYGYEFQTGVIPSSQTGWTLVGNGANATSTYRSTFANMYSTALSRNRGFTVSLHDSAETGNAGPTGITDAEYTAGAVSPDHIAWVLAMLQKKGHIKVVGPEEYFEWVTGDYAPGTDLINNPRCLIPQFDIGDTLGATSEYAIIRGLGTMGLNGTSQTAAGHQFRSLTVEQTGNVAKYARRAGATTADNPYYAIGDSVTGTRGRPGGVLFYADSANTSPNKLDIGFGNLKPGGKYRFSIDANFADNTALIIEEYHLAWGAKFQKNSSSYRSGMSPAYRDTLIEWQWRDVSDSHGEMSAVYHDTWGTFQMAVNPPYGMYGETVAGADYGSVSEAATGTRLYKPYAPTAGLASEGVLVDSKWVWTFTLNAVGAARMSNPKLIYLGQQ